MDPRKYEKHMEFPSKIRELSMNNVIIKRIIDDYAMGGILTREEAWARMVEMLARNWADEQRRYCDEMMATRKGDAQMITSARTFDDEFSGKV